MRKEISSASGSGNLMVLSSDPGRKDTVVLTLQDEDGRQANIGFVIDHTNIVSLLQGLCDGAGLDLSDINSAEGHTRTLRIGFPLQDAVLDGWTKTKLGVAYAGLDKDLQDAVRKLVGAAKAGRV